MRVLVQRVKEASVKVDEKIVGSIGYGYLLFVGFKKDDNVIKDPKIYKKMLDKILALRICSDSEGKMNKNLFEVNGSLLVVSQFTLYADTLHTNRPSFTDALSYSEAEVLFNQFVLDLKQEIKLRQENTKVETGIFGADMLVDIQNDGPVTILIEY